MSSRSRAKGGGQGGHRRNGEAGPWVSRAPPPAASPGGLWRGAFGSHCWELGLIRAWLVGFLPPVRAGLRPG